MYPVSANFHTLAIQDAPKTRVRIYFIGDAVDCTDDNAVQTNGTLLIGKAGDTDSNGRIGQNGITFSEFFNPDKNIQVGAAVSSQIGMTLLNTDGALDNFQYGRCKVYLDVYDTANSSWLTCPMGVYIIDLPTKRKVQLVNATGYDQMQKLDEICDTWWSALNWSGGITLSQLLTSLATQIGVSVSSNTASAIVNGSVSFTEEPFQCIEVTYREVLEYIAEATGTVARFDRNGALDLRWFAAAQISGNTVTVNTDTVGNQCLAISVAEYSVAAVDLLKVKLYTDDIGTTVGTGTNQYTIVNNLFLDGANSAAIIAKATPIYNRLHGLGAYSPVSARIITDWSIEAGDIINIVNDSTTYSVPIFQQSMAWRGGYVVSDLLSDGDNVRPVLDYDERTYYRLNSEMSKKVGDNEIISKINQSPESITIQANKVNLTGYVTFTNLSTDGQTSISGGNIITGTITADKLNANNINASKTLTVGALTDAAAATVLNSNIAIGGRNLCTGTATAKTLTTAANQNYFTPSVYPLSAYSATALSDASNTQVTVSFDYSITGVDTVFPLLVGFYGGQAYTEIVTAKAGIPIGSSAGHAEATNDITNNMRQYAHEKGVLFGGSGNANANAVLTVSNLKVEIGNKATTWTQAPEDVAADIATAQSTAEGANSQEQLIYRSKAVGTTSISGTTTWVTNTTGNQDTWTIKRPQYNTSYPVMFIATQRKTVGETVTCTTPQIDDTITVIDGGNIITGTVTANQIAGGTITSTNLATALNNTINTAYSNASTALSNAATAQSTAESANSQEQLIYISKVSGTTTQSATTTWVTNNTGNQNTWTIKRPTYNSSYPVLFVATQRKNVAGTVTCTTPQIDNTTTVIDGGHITTGTIDAGVVNVTNINASNITTGTLSADYIKGGALELGGPGDYRGKITIYPAWANPADNMIGTIDAASHSFWGTTSLNATGQTTKEYYLNHYIGWGDFSSKVQEKTSGTLETLSSIGFLFTETTNPYGVLILHEYSYSNNWSQIKPTKAVFTSSNNVATTNVSQTDGKATTQLKSANYYATLAASQTDGKSTLQLLTNTSSDHDGTVRVDGIYLDTSGSTFDSVIDVTQRRCYASLSSAGWYRVLKIAGGTGAWSFSVDFDITRAYNNTNNEVHSVKLLKTYNTTPSFVNEVSKTNDLNVSEIRYTIDSNGVGYVDIRYDANSANTVTVDFTVHTNPAQQQYFTAKSLGSVGSSPSGETVLTEYSFANNTEGDVSSSFSSSKGGFNAYRCGKMVTVTFLGNSTTWTEDEVFGTIGSSVIPVLSYIDVVGYIGRQAVVVRLNQNGNITLWTGSTLTGNQRLYFSCTYPIL